MGSLAGLLTDLGHEVSGSDVAFDPPMGPLLERWGVRCVHGFAPEHLEPAPDLVVVGNVCRRDNPEVTAAKDKGIVVTHVAGALRQFVLEGTAPLVVAGTHGKTTTTALSAFLLERTGFEPGYLIGGVPQNFERSFHLPSKHRRPGALRKPPFVIEGDEYDTAFFEKTPKFLHYRPTVAILTSIEHDHVDIYPTEREYLDAFRAFVEQIPPDGLLVANAADPRVVRVAEAARAEVRWFALEGEETHGRAPHWVAAPGKVDDSGTSFDVFAGGVACGRHAISLSGNFNVKNALAALGAVSEGYGARLADLRLPLAEFRGVRRRQELLGKPRGIYLYDDFAHHPTAVLATLSALRRRHQAGRLFALFEARSATACRRMHQEEYARSFEQADEILLAPLGRSGLSAEERLDLDQLRSDLCDRGKRAENFPDHESMIASVAERAKDGDVVVVLSNGAFGGIQGRLLSALG
jgi:UDP-N-acetylmuramate: L-alanyl-gamma-D-glutamyl-meso-diaminopimelate ligase